MLGQRRFSGVSNDRARRGKGHRVAPERSGKRTGFPDVIAFANHDHGNRHTRAEALGHHDHVGLDVAMLEPPSPSGPKHPCLYLIGDQGDFETVCQVAQRLGPTRVGRQHAALTEDEFGDDRRGGADAGVGCGELLDGRHCQVYATFAPDAEGTPIVLGEGQKRRPRCHHYGLLPKSAAGACRARSPGAAVETSLHANMFTPTGGDFGKREGRLDSAGTAGRTQVDPAVGGQSRRQDGEQVFDELLPRGGMKVQRQPGLTGVNGFDDRLTDHRMVPTQRHRPSGR
ncbi:Acetylornithine aminotransferase [Mycobacterium marinum MB2]|nr:Acetylornithine aminotransferase [Mycobacterium marinum MB2]